MRIEEAPKNTRSVRNRGTEYGGGGRQHASWGGPVGLNEVEGELADLALREKKMSVRGGRGWRADRAGAAGTCRCWCAAHLLLPTTTATMRRAGSLTDFISHGPLCYFSDLLQTTTGYSRRSLVPRPRQPALPPTEPKSPIRQLTHHSTALDHPSAPLLAWLLQMA